MSYVRLSQEHEYTSLRFAVAPRRKRVPYYSYRAHRDPNLLLALEIEACLMTAPFAKHARSGPPPADDDGVFEVSCTVPRILADTEIWRSPHGMMRAGRIQRTIWAAFPHTNVVVPPGIYDEDVYMGDKEIHLVGSPSVLLRGILIISVGRVSRLQISSPLAACCLGPFGSLVTLAEGRGVLEQCRVTVEDDSMIAVLCLAEYCGRVHHNYILGGRVGIQVSGNANPLISWNIICLAREVGVWFQANASGIVRMCEISECSFSAVTCTRTKLATISSNRLLRCGAGLLATDQAVVVVSKNSVFENHGHGIELRNVKSCLVSSNHVFSNSLGVFVHEGSQGQVVRNWIGFNRQVGIWLLGGCPTSLCSNVLIGNTQSGICIASPAERAGGEANADAGVATSLVGNRAILNGTGILVLDLASVELDSDEFTCNTMYGIEVREWSNAKCSRINVLGNRSGARVHTHASLTCVESTFSNQQQTAILADGQGKLTIEACVIRHTSDSGVLISGEGTHGTCRCCQISFSQRVGACVTDNASLILEANEISGNPDYGITAALNAVCYAFANAVLQDHSVAFRLDTGARLIEKSNVVSGAWSADSLSSANLHRESSFIAHASRAAPGDAASEPPAFVEPDGAFASYRCPASIYGCQFERCDPDQCELAEHLRGCDFWQAREQFQSYRSQQDDVRRAISSHEQESCKLQQGTAELQETIERVASNVQTSTTRIARPLGRNDVVCRVPQHGSIVAVIDGLGKVELGRWVTVIVPAGLYRESVVVPSNVCLSGPDDGTAIIDPLSGTGVILSCGSRLQRLCIRQQGASAAIEVRAAGAKPCVITNCEVTCCSTGGIVCISGNAVIERSLVSNAHCGLVVGVGASARLVRSTICGAREAGIWFQAGSSGAIHMNHIWGYAQIESQGNPC